MKTQTELRPWTYSPQKGTIGHCLMAQVWDLNGRPIADIEPTQNEAEATNIARLIAAAPYLLVAAQCVVSAFDGHEGAGDSELSFLIGAIKKATEE